MAQVFVRKPLETILAEADESGERTLRRTLGPFSLTCIGIGSIIGTGIFVLTGSAAANHAGPAIVVSFIVAAIGCVFSGLCYAEFASMIPVAGSAYTYCYATLGEFVAWMIGWDLILEYGLGAATVASGWSGYLISFLQDFGISIPPRLSGSPGTIFVFYNEHWQRLTPQLQDRLLAAHVNVSHMPHQTSTFNLLALAAILVVTALLVVGIRESVNVNIAVVILKVCVLLVFVGLAVRYIYGHHADAMSNWRPFLPANGGHWGEFGFSGIAAGAGVIFFAYIGFDQVSTAAQEANNPARDLPVGILGSLILCTILYIAVALSLTGLVHYFALNVPDPVAVAVDATGVRWGRALVKAGAILGLSSAMIVTLLGQSRIFLSMARDGLLPPAAAIIHSRFRTPYISTIVVGACVALTAAFTPIQVISELVSMGTLLAFVIVCTAVWVLRRRRLEIQRVFKAPWMPFTAAAGVLVSILMMCSLGWETSARLSVWLAIGAAVYFSYGRRHSRLQRNSSREFVQRGLVAGAGRFDGEAQ